MISILIIIASAPTPHVGCDPSPVRSARVLFIGNGFPIVGSDNFSKQIDLRIVMGTEELLQHDVTYTLQN